MQSPETDARDDEKHVSSPHGFKCWKSQPERRVGRLAAEIEL